MNKKIEDLMYQAGLTADGCWNEMDAYDRGAIERLIGLVVKASFDVVINDGRFHDAKSIIRAGKYAAMEHLGVEE